jgi:hypothetical protein
MLGTRGTSAAPERRSMPPRAAKRHRRLTQGPKTPMPRRLVAKTTSRKPRQAMRRCPGSLQEADRRPQALQDRGTTASVSILTSDEIDSERINAKRESTPSAIARPSPPLAILIRSLPPKAQSLRLRALELTRGIAYANRVCRFGCHGRAHGAQSHRAGLLTGVWNRTAARRPRSPGTSLSSPSPPWRTRRQLRGRGDLRVGGRGLAQPSSRASTPGLSPNMIVMDCSTVGARNGARNARQLAALGVGFLDCPVSGGVEGARAATLAIMVGGDEPVFARAADLGKTRQDHHLFRAERRGAGGEGHQSNHVRGHHPGGRRSDGLCARRRAAARPADRYAWARARARAGTSSIARPSWPTMLFPPAFACAARQGFADLPRHGGEARRAAAGGGVDLEQYASG